MPQVLHIYKDFAPRRGGGGVARHIDGLATVAVQEGFASRVVAPEVEANDGSENYSIFQANGLGLWSHIGWADVIHVHGARNPLAAKAALMACWRGKRLVYTPHCYYDNDASRLKRLVKRLWDISVEQWLLSKSDAVVLLDDVWLGYLKQRGLKVAHPVVLPNCVRADMIKTAVTGTLSGAPALLSVGRLDSVKRLEDAILALNEPGLERAVFHVVGSGTDRTRLEGIVAMAGLSSRVCFHGFVDDEQVAVMAQSADAFVLPSSAEGMPTVLIEMILQGCPVIASDIPGNRAILGVVGLEECLFPVGDVRALAACIRARDNRVIDHHVQLKTRVGFTWEGMRARIRALYEAAD